MVKNTCKLDKKTYLRPIKRNIAVKDRRSKEKNQILVLSLISFINLLAVYVEIEADVKRSQQEDVQYKQEIKEANKN